MEFSTEGLGLRLDLAWLEWAVEPGRSGEGFRTRPAGVGPDRRRLRHHDLEATNDGQHVYPYDSFGGGIGISRPAFERLGEIARLGAEVAADCPCEYGCPGCIQLSRRHEGNRWFSKPGALHLLQSLSAVLNGVGAGSSSLNPAGKDGPQ